MAALLRLCHGCCFPRKSAFGVNGDEEVLLPTDVKLLRKAEGGLLRKGSLARAPSWPGPKWGQEGGEETPIPLCPQAQPQREGAGASNSGWLASLWGIWLPTVLETRWVLREATGLSTLLQISTDHHLEGKFDRPSARGAESQRLAFIVFVCFSW